MTKVMQKIGFSKREVLFLAFIITFILLFSEYSYASSIKIGVLELAQKYIEFIQALFKWLAAAAIFVTIFLFLQQRPIWIYGIGLVIVCAIVGNLNAILTVLGLTGSVCF
ncbi:MULTISPECIES: hypothetical protein [unclassified Fusobacterium]|uniref:hypothetical protein n=1 Tax=unclassified Fusobacterium TaxID=2648384 RepID=UPI001B8AD3A7|nr:MULTISPECIES: hypothetical protein [unclassified Fusobacterium]MBR8700485.1 hypothetical protein [Fusobacterium sp. DD45]MBR8710250.1 hypothetical protein [Fusobacterium sp. DD28]MBR8750772.1 hypothetical protein [Fusobacterium sp. DD26]